MVELVPIFLNQKASISELKALLDEERDQRREEREKASLDMKMAIQRVQADATEEIKRVSDGALRREKEQQEMINKLQEDTRQKLVNSDNKVRQLEGQIFQEQQAVANNRKRVEELEQDRKRLRKELEREKLRAFYSTTEEISALFAKQQEQLKAMQRTLEDEENYETTSIDIDLNQVDGNENRSIVRDKDEAHQSNSTAKASSGALRNHGTDQLESSNDEASVTEKHDCTAKSQENGLDTQEVDFTGPQCNAKGAFGSDINGVGTASNSNGDAIGTEQIPDTEGPIFEGCAVETERVLETESPGLQSGKTFDLNKTMQVDNDTSAQEAPEHAEEIHPEPSDHSRSNSLVEAQDPMEDTEGGGTIKTTDLLASEVAGSWACSTAPSVHGENDSPGRSKDDDDEECAVPVHDSSSLVAESQHIPLTKSEADARRNHERSSA
ncbi:hypothetical protein DH2020_003730 [Rehmannia glutinosa]|uniref:Uncharacterized protein n=1 Tax=Rehmannia glutinosa TaxID=99300 RepID=A0ABR0XMF0_REHGL